MDSVSPERFWRNGVVVVPAVLTDADLDLVRDQVDAHLANEAAGLTEVQRSGAKGGRFAYGHDVLRHVAAMRAVLRVSPLVPEVVEILGGERPVTLLDSQIYVKEPFTAAPTPWHQDASYWPISGQQLCTAWIALDRVCPENGGLQFVLGSHGWDRVFRARAFAPGQQVADPSHEPVPDDGALRAEHMLCRRSWPRAMPWSSTP